MTKHLSKSVIAIVILGIALRLILAVTTYHGDLAALVLAGKSLAVNHQVIDFYQSVFTIGEQGELKLPDHQMTFIYQPLAYFIPGIVYLPFADIIKNLSDGLLHTNPYLLDNKIAYPPLLIYKLPLIFADLGVLFLLPMLFFKRRQKQLSIILWSLNPIAIYVSSMIGQVDAILTFFLVAGLVAFKRNSYTLSALLFTLSALVKPIGLILLPIVAISSWYEKKSISSTIGTIFVGPFAYLLVIAPFLPSIAYRQYTLFAEHINKTLFSGIAISPGTAIPWFFIAYAVIIALVIRKKISPLYALGASLLTSLSFTHFHPQWFVWITPWLIYYLITNRDWIVYSVSFLAWFVILMSFESSLTYDIFFGLNLRQIAAPVLMGNNLATLVLLSRAWLVALLVVLLDKDLEHEAKN